VAADVLVTWTIDADGVTLRVFERRTARSLVRHLTLPESAGPEERSTTLEAAALIVRGGLRDMLAGRSHEGVAPVANSVEPLPTPERTRVEEPVVSGVSSTDAYSDQSASSSVGFVGHLGWRVGVDGHSPVGQHAADLSLGLGWRRLRIDATGGIGIPTTTVDQWTEVSVITVRTVLGALLNLVRHPSWSATIGADVGVVLWHRRTRAVSPLVITTPDNWSSSVVVSPRFGAAFFPRGLGGVVGVRLDLAVDVLPMAPRFVYGGTVTSSHGALWNVQPWLRLSLALRTAR
jgi:hypothetical protein